MKILKTTILALAITASSAFSQLMTYTNVQTYDSAFYPHYYYTQQGNPVQGPYSFAFYSFQFSVKDATGSAAFLNGEDYIGFCVNTMFPDPQNNYVATYSPGPDLLTYNLGTGDYWATDRDIKWDAIVNTLAYYSNQLRTLAPNSQSYAELVTGINMAFTEVIVDYDGTLASINLNAGNSTAKLNSNGDPITAGVPYDTYTYIRNNLIGTGNGNGFKVYTANNTGDNFQDLAFIPVVPEPTTTGLLAIGALTFFVTIRKRKVSGPN